MSFADNIAATDETVLPYGHISIPTAAEAASWIAALGAVPAEGPADAAHATDLAARFCGLAYARQGTAAARSATLRPRGQPQDSPEVIEFQFQGGDNFGRGAHCVAYLYRTGAISMGVGVVLALKGPSPSLKEEDWVYALRDAMDSDAEPSEPLFPDLSPTGPDSSVDPLLAKAKVHSLVAQHIASLRARMACCSLASMRGLLEDWRAPSTAPHFWAWLCTPGAWQWCAVVGHSFGGALATTLAAELAARSCGTVLLASLNSPAVGNQAFVSLLEEHVHPTGGLRAVAEGDLIAAAGGRSGLAKLRHGGREVLLPSRARQAEHRDAYHRHLWLSVPSAIGARGGSESVMFQFPGCAQRYISDAEADANALGRSWVQERLVVHAVDEPIPDSWLEDRWWARPGPAAGSDAFHKKRSRAHGGGADGPAWGGGSAPP